MIDPELKTQLAEINSHLSFIEKHSRLGIWRSFFNGMFSGVGYLFGVAVVLTVVGWFLNKAGVIPAIKKQIQSIQGLIDQAKQLQGGGDKVMVLPDGREVRLKSP